MTERLPRDHEQRRQALDPAHSFLVQAPAGSGKTELLTDRILALLAGVSRPEEIVAITFTRKAAAEMHARVLGKLAEARGPAPQDPHRRASWELARRALERDRVQGWDLLAHPARLSIRTIDAFCASLVRSMPWLSELGGMPGIADDARAHYEAAARATLELAGDYPEVRTLLAHLDVDVQAAQQALADMLGQRDQWLPLLRAGSDQVALEQALREAIDEELGSLAAAMPAGWAPALAECARLAAASLDEAAPGHPLAALADWDGEPFAPDASQLARWRALAQLLLTAQGELRKARGVTVKLGFPAKSRHKDVFCAWLEQAAQQTAPWTARLAAARGLPAPELSDAQREILRAQLGTLALCAAQLRLRFAEAGEVDFIEVAQRASAALGSADEPGDLLLALDAGIRHLLIDEFQDTSQTQIELLRTLTSGWQAGDGRTLFLVGDPMQSIYRFRKAEVGLFLQVRDQGLGEVRPRFLQLTENFRSQAGIVEWVNRVFAQLLPPHNDAAVGAIRYAPSHAFHGALDGPAVRFHPVWAQGGDAGARAEDLVVELAREALLRHAGSAHPVAILVRARSHLGTLSRRLAQAGIACRAVDLVPLAQRPVVSDLVQLARAWAHPGDRLAWLSVLRAPWCGATLATLDALFGDDHAAAVPALLAQALAPGGRAHALPPDELARLARAAAVLLDRDNASGGEPFAAWLERAWRRLGGPRLYTSVSDAADAESLFQLIERIAPYGSLDPARLEAEVARLYASPEGGAGPAVEIMTMHKAKGLQFDTVILYGLQRPPRAEQAPLVRFEQSEGRVLLGPVKARADAEADPLSRYLGRREKQRADYETDRLLYVAATRARERLHLVAEISADDAGAPARPAPASLLARLWPHLELPAGVPTEPGSDAAPPADAIAGPPLRRIASEVLAAEPLAPDGPVAPAPPAMASAQDRDSVPASISTAAPAMASPSAPAGAPPSGAGLGVPAWRAESADEAIVGTVAHAWLARLGEEGSAALDPEALRARLPAIRRLLTRSGLPAAAADAAAGEVLETLEATLASERGRWLLSLSEARREWALLDMAGKVSVLDLALSTEAGWLVVDYKTGRPRPDEPPADFAARMRARHAAQMARYCAHLAALDGRPARAALYFPRADLWLDMDPAAPA